MDQNINDAPTNTATNNLEFSDASPYDDSGAHQRRSKKSVVLALLDEYFSIAGINGVQYFTERKRHWSERLFWIIAFIVSLVLSGYLIWDPWCKWNETPVIVTFDDKTTPIWDIPFPAVTICPETKFNTSKLDYAEAYETLKNFGNESLTDETFTKMYAASHVCDIYLNLNRPNSSENPNIIDILKEISLTVEDTLLFSRGDRGGFFKFNPILTEEGICFTFNALNSHEIYTDAIAPEMLTVENRPDSIWNLEQGYLDRAENADHAYPHRVPSAGIKHGVEVMLRVFEKDLEYVCRGAVKGFKIVLHTPDELPRVSKKFFRVPLNTEVMVSLTPRMITTKDRNLRQYEPTKRGCYFNSDRSLKFFKSYSQHNCEVECLANFTLRECGCVYLAMPREANTPICDVPEYDCCGRAEYFMLKTNLDEGLEREYYSNFCDCLPACTSITYDAEISQANLFLSNFVDIFRSDTDYVKARVSQLIIFFKEHHFTPSRRSELYGLVDFLANCGGLLGLCIGISFLGIVEIIYFFTLRLYCTLRMQRQN